MLYPWYTFGASYLQREGSLERLIANGALERSGLPMGKHFVALQRHGVGCAFTANIANLRFTAGLVPVNVLS